MTGLVEGKVVLVTGGSKGIGKAIVEACARNGAAVLFTYNSGETESKGIIEALTAEGLNVSCLKADVSDPEGVKMLFKAVKERLGRLDALVNNAGVVSNNLLLMTSDSEYQKVIGTNCTGSFLCLRAAVKMMMPKRSGKIVNIASIVGVHGNSGQVAYSASKAFVIGMTKAAAKELGPHGITVNAVAPGVIDTNMTNGLKAEIKEELLGRVALGRIGTPQDVAGAVLFLLSPMSDYVSGQVLGVDGCQGL